MNLLSVLVFAIFLSTGSFGWSLKNAKTDVTKAMEVAYEVAASEWTKLMDAMEDHGEPFLEDGEELVIPYRPETSYSNIAYENPGVYGGGWGTQVMNPVVLYVRGKLKKPYFGPKYQLVWPVDQNYFPTMIPPVPTLTPEIYRPDGPLPKPKY